MDLFYGKQYKCSFWLRGEFIQMCLLSKILTTQMAKKKGLSKVKAFVSDGR